MNFPALLEAINKEGAINLTLEEKHRHIIMRSGEEGEPTLFFNEFRPGHYVAHFEYGYDYNSYVPNVNDKPNTMTKFAASRKVESIARQIYNMYEDCYKYFETVVKPRKEEGDAYEKSNRDKLMRVAILIGDKIPPLGDDRLHGVYRNGAPYAKDIRAVSAGFDFQLQNVPEELAMKILHLVYKG